MTAVRKPRWWAKDAEDPHVTIHDIVRKLRQDGRAERYRAYESMYASPVNSLSDALTTSLFGGSKSGTWQRTPVLRSVIDTQMNRLGRARPSPWPVTEAGDFKAQRRAELLKTWLEGWFDKLKVDQLARQALLDGLCLGTGALKGYLSDGLPTIEHVWPGDLHVDKREEEKNCVRSLYQTSAVDRSALIDRFPDFEQEIEDAPEYDPNADGSNVDDPSEEMASDLVLVVEAWRLPTTKDEKGEWKGGKHFVCLENVVLNDKDTDWCRPGFPFAFFRYRIKSKCFWGLGLVESAGCMQADLNELDEVIHEAYRLMTPAMLAQSGSIVVKAQTNEVGRIIEYSGDAPTPWTPNPVSPQLLERGEQLESRILRMEGVSPFSSQSVKPAGLESGLALTTHEDIESERHALPAQGFEGLHMGIAELFLDLTDEVAGSEPEDDDEDKASYDERVKRLSVLGGKDTLELISYADARLPRDKMILRMWPVSRFSRSVTGKITQVEKLNELGMFPNPDDLFEILDFPDTQSAANIRLAARKLVRLMVDRALDGKEAYIHPYMDLDYLIQYASHRFCDAQINGAEDDALSRVDELINAALKEMEKQKVQPTPVGALAAGGMDMGMGGAALGLPPGAMPPPGLPPAMGMPMGFPPPAMPGLPPTPELPPGA